MFLIVEIIVKLIIKSPMNQFCGQQDRGFVNRWYFE